MIQKILLFLFRDVPPSIQVTRRCRAVVGGSIASDIRDGETPNEDQDTVFHSSEQFLFVACPWTISVRAVTIAIVAEIVDFTRNFVVLGVYIGRAPGSLVRAG